MPSTNLMSYQVSLSNGIAVTTARWACHVTAVAPRATILKRSTSRSTIHGLLASFEGLDHKVIRYTKKMHAQFDILKGRIARAIWAGCASAQPGFFLFNFVFVTSSRMSSSAASSILYSFLPLDNRIIGAVLAKIMRREDWDLTLL